MIPDQGINYRIGRFPFAASGRARAAGDTDGFVKVLSERQYGEILGAHAIGAQAADIIAQAVVAIQYEITDSDMATISYAQPIFSEEMKEAYLGASGLGMLNF